MVSAIEIAIVNKVATVIVRYGRRILLIADNKYNKAITSTFKKTQQTLVFINSDIHNSSQSCRLPRYRLIVLEGPRCLAARAWRGVNPKT